jgi:hypothetical protein
MSVSRVELLLWLAANDDEHIDAYADLISAGLVVAESDGDCVVALTATATGRAKLAPVLPTATA